MDGKKILLVEGDNDKYVVIHICERCDILQIRDINIIHPSGVDGVLKALPEQIRNASEEGDVVGAIVDADTNLSKIWDKFAKLSCLLDTMMCRTNQ